MFHVSALKKNLGTATIASTSLPTRPDIAEWIPEQLLDRGFVNRHNRAVTRWLIKWKDHPVEEATWEDYEDIRRRFPSFQA